MFYRAHCGDHDWRGGALASPKRSRLPFLRLNIQTELREPPREHPTAILPRVEFRRDRCIHIWFSTPVSKQPPNTRNKGFVTTNQSLGHLWANTTAMMDPGLPTAVPIEEERPLPMAVPLEPGHALVLPSSSLERVFLGLSWQNADGKTVDLDCSVVGYGVTGERDSQSTIWYGRLRNSVSKQGKGHSIVHTGDVLKGQDDVLAGTKDAERIYVWLNELPDNLHTLAFAADVFTSVTFAALTSAYVRLVNADTGQELAALSLSGAHLGPAAESRVMLLCRLRRLGTSGLWSLDATAEPRPRTLREEHGAQPDMTPPVWAVPAGVPIAPVVPVAPVPTALPVALPIAPIGTQGAGLPPQPQPQSDKAPPAAPSVTAPKPWACPALAVATEAGIGAATAIFFSSDESPLSRDMLAAAQFSDGVDFTYLIPPDLGGASEFFAGVGLETVAGALGTALEGAGDAVGSVVQSAGAAVGDALGGSVGDTVGDAVGNASSGCFDACNLDCLGCGGGFGSGADEAAKAVSSAATDTASSVSDGAATMLAGAGELAGAVIVGAGEVADTVLTGAGELVGGLGEAASGLATGVGEMAGSLGDAAEPILKGAGEGVLAVGGAVAEVAASALSG